MKFVLLGYGYTAVLFGSLVLLLHLAHNEAAQSPIRVALLASIFFLTPVRQHIRRQRTRTTITPDEFIHEFGERRLYTTRFDIFQIEKVHTESGPLQRLAGAGTIYVKKFDELQRVPLEHYDAPKKLAELLLQRAQPHVSPLVKAATVGRL